MPLRSPRRRLSRQYVCLSIAVFSLVFAGRDVIRAAGSGTSQQDAGLSCKAILASGQSTGDGLYWIDPNGGDHADAFEAYCDMTTDGGGWTLAVNSVAGEEPPTNDMTSNMGAAGLDRGHTRDLTNLAINNNAQIRYYLDNTANGRVYHAKFTGRYHDALPLFADWTTLAGHLGGSDTLLTNQFGRSWSTALADRDLIGGSCAQFYGNVPWHYGNCWNSMPTDPSNGSTQGPPANGGGIILPRFSIFVREVADIVIPPTHIAPSFRPAVNVPVGGGPADVATGDFDNDGRADIVTASSLTGVHAIDIRYGNGAMLHQAAPPGPHHIATGHFTADNLLDFVLANAGGQITAYINQGASFTPISFSGCVASGIATGDFDKNGTTDIALACANGPFIVASGNGGGGFSIVSSLNTGIQTTSLAVADFNSDGELDVVVTGGSTGCFDVFLGGSAFTFAPVLQCAGTFMGPVAVGDFIGDTNPDLVVGSADTVSVLGNVGGGFFSPAGAVGGPSVNAVALGDLDLDGRLDLVLARATATIQVHRGLLGGVFGPPVQFNTSTAGRAVAVGDFDGDGKKDVVTADNLTDSISVLFNSFVANLPPSASNGTLTVIEGTTENGTLAGSDPESAALTFALTSTGTKGSASLLNASTGAYSYAANPGESGTDTFTFTVSDGVNTSAPGTITVTITPKLTPQITWGTPAPIVFGTALDGAQLNATADVVGTFVYSPAAGTVLAAGTAQSLTVTFTPEDTVHYASVSSGVLIDVLQAGTTTSLSASLSTLAVLQPVKLTATVGSGAAGAGVPTGTVTFFDGATPIGSAPLAAGVAALTVNGLGSGPHTLNARYDGTGNFAQSLSAPVPVTVRPASQSAFTLLFAPTAPTALGQPVTFAALVLALGGGPAPTGTVVFVDGSTVMGVATLSGGVATITTTSLAAGPHFLFAVYVGSASFGASVSSPAVHNVFTGAIPPTLTLALSASPAPATLGSPVTLSVVLPPASGTPTGTVVFLADNVVIGTAPVTNVGGLFRADVTTSGLAAGVHLLSAIYLGDGVFGASGVGPIVLAVQ